MYTIEVQDLSISKTFVLESFLAPVQSINGMAGVVTIDPIKIGLGSVNNTADIDKPISIPVSGALVSLKQQVESELVSLEQKILSQVQLSSSEDLEFQIGLYSGIDFLNVYYPRNLAEKPKSVTCSIENNIDDLIYNHQISNVTNVGFDIEFSDYLSSDGYILHVVASI
jgi:hypothetical protein